MFDVWSSESIWQVPERYVCRHGLKKVRIYARLILSTLTPSGSRIAMLSRRGCYMLGGATEGKNNIGEIYVYHSGKIFNLFNS